MDFWLIFYRFVGLLVCWFVAFAGFLVCWLSVGQLSGPTVPGTVAACPHGQLDIFLLQSLILMRNSIFLEPKKQKNIPNNKSARPKVYQQIDQKSYQNPTKFNQKSIKNQPKLGSWGLLGGSWRALGWIWASRARVCPKNTFVVSPLAPPRWTQDPPKIH